MSEENGGSDRPLTGKQKAFVEAYALCLNATHAARLAKYEGDDASLASQGSKLLRNDKVRKALDVELERQGAMPKNEVLAHWTDIARGDIADVLTNGAVDMNEAIRRGRSHLVRRVKTKTTIIDNGDDDSREIHETEIEMYSRENALDKLGRFYGLLIDRTDITTLGEKLPAPMVYLPGVTLDEETNNE